MKQLTIRGFGRDIERKIQQLARAEGISLNQAVLRLLRKASGPAAGEGRSDAIGGALDDLAGTWTADQEKELLEAIKPLEQIDEELWR